MPNSCSTTPSNFAEHGWCRREVDQDLLAWCESVQAVAQDILCDPQHAHWWRHGQTWFAGVNILPNDNTGKVANGVALSADLQQWLRRCLHLQDSHSFQWEQGQLSVLRPGYPQRDANETETAHNYRRKRDAAHVDGLLPVGPTRRRMPQEFHHFILGIPLHPSPTHAGATVVWEGSHLIMQQALSNALQGIPQQDWPSTDITEIYQQTRREVFTRCKRVEIHVPPGEAYLIHRLAVHGVAPWDARNGDDGQLRSVAFFRPEVEQRQDWLTGF